MPDNELIGIVMRPNPQDMFFYGGIIRVPASLIIAAPLQPFLPLFVVMTENNAAYGVRTMQTRCLLGME